MKIKHLIASVGFAATAALGMIALSGANKDATPVKADSGDTWMFGVYLDAKAIDSSYKAQCSNFRFHVWGTNVDKTVPMHLSGTDDLYTVNVSFTDDQVVTHGQFIFDQNGADKYSTDQSFNYSKDSDFFGHMSWEFAESWSDGKWTATNQKSSRAMLYFTDSEGAEQQLDFTPVPANNEFRFDNLVVNGTNIGKTFDLLVRGFWNDGYNIIYNMDYVGTGAAGWFTFSQQGTYDLVIHNSYLDDGSGHTGTLEIIQHEDKSDSFIYYMTESATATTDYIYSWGGSEQFGDFPGTAIASIEGLEEKTGNGRIRFQGNAKLIYEIPIAKGYPEGDRYFMFNNGTDEYKSEERAIAKEHAYWWTGDANHDAAQALNFVTLVDTYIGNSEDDSACLMSKPNASFLVTFYNGYGEDIRDTYIDCSTYYTWTDNTKTEKAYFTYRQIMERLAIIAETSLDGSKTINTNLTTSTMIGFLLSISAVTALSVTMLFVFKKKRQF